MNRSIGFVKDSDGEGGSGNQRWLKPFLFKFLVAHALRTGVAPSITLAQCYRS